MATAAIKEGIKKLKITELKGTTTRTDMGDLLSLAKSISERGLLNPVIVDGTNTIIAGFRRVEACKLLKWEELEVRSFDTLSEFERRLVLLEEELAQKKTLSWQEEVSIKAELHRLYTEAASSEKGDKRKGQRGEKPWSQGSTAEKISVARTSLSEDLRLDEALKMFPELNQASTKKDAIRKMYILREMALNKAIAEKMRSEGIEIDDDVQLKLADSFEEMKKLPDSSFDCCITDPPWGIEIEKAGSARSREDYGEFKDTQDVYELFLKDGLPEIFRVLKEGSHFWLFFGAEFYEKTKKRLSEVGFEVRVTPCIWVKEKPNYTDTEYKPMPQYEMFFYAVKHTDKKVAPRRLNEATSDYFLYQRQTLDRIHRTEKPVELIKRLVSLSTVENDRILDPFAGSASTLCAALLTRRKALGFEKEKEIFDRADARLQTLRVEEEAKADANADAEIEKTA